MKRRLAAILAADVVGYTRLMGADEAGTLRRVTELRRQVLEPLIGKHNGRVVKLIGDGLLVEFASVVDALDCAVAWQSAVTEKEAAIDEPKRLKFRIGINLGDVIVEDDDIHGDGVNIAARLESLAEPRGICLSGDAYRQVRGKTRAGFEDLGERKLKNVVDPVQVYRVVIGESPKDSSRPSFDSSSVSEKPSIAVLPFVNMSGDREQEYFAHGITEDIITDLSRFRELLVISRNSSFQYKGKSNKVQTIAQDLGVQFIVEGSLQRSGERLRATVQLIDASNGSHVWAERYHRTITDLFALQDEIVESIVQTLVERIRSVSERRASRKGQQAVAAYDYVLQARAVIMESREKMEASRTLYEKATKLDPECGHAYAGMAQNHLFEWTSGWSKSPTESLDLALACARNSALLDDLDSEAQRRIGIIHLFRGEREQAETHLTRALALNPNDADAMAGRGLYLIYEGRPLDALKELERATRRNPFHPTYYYWWIGLALYEARRYEEAIAPLRKAIDSFPDFVAPHRHLAACYAQLRLKDMADREAAIILELEPQFSVTKIARTFAYRDAADLEHYCEGLRKAGLPD